MRSHEIPPIIRKALAERRTTPFRAALDAELPENAIRTILDGHEPKVGRLAEVCEALGLEFYIGPPREGARWGRLAMSADLPGQILELVERVAAQYEDWSGPHRDKFLERFTDAIDRLLHPWPPKDEFKLDTLDPFPRKTQDPNYWTESADPSVWTNATAEERLKAGKRLLAVEKVNAVIDGGHSRSKAEAIVARELDVSPSAVRTWRQRVHGLSGTVRRAALVDAPRTGRPSAIDPEMRETMEQLASNRGRQFTAKQAREILILRHGKAPSVSTIRRHLSRLRKNRSDRQQDQGTSDTEGVHSFVDEPPATEADDADRLGRALEAAEKIVAAAGIELGHQEKARLVLAIYRELQDAGADSRASEPVHSGHRVA